MYIRYFYITYMKSIQQNIKNLKVNGITTIKNVLSAKQCNLYTKYCNEVFQKLLKKKRTHSFNKNCQWVQSPFRFDSNFFNLIYFKNVDKILSKLLGIDYTITNTTIFNRRILNHKNISGLDMGDTWHTDSRYLDGRRLDKGFGYLVLLMFEDFTKENGATKYVPKSHLLRSIPPKNQKKYKYKLITGKKGTMVIIDTGIWHKGGAATTQSRWSLFNFYSPWFIKPYYQYEKMIGKTKFKTLNKKVKKILHYNSTPPLHDDIRVSTVTRI